jgi:ADP-L-glycero-D-manno-heptose 6-epimerase
MIIVTGAAGFIGFRTVEALMRSNETVMRVDILTAFGANPEHRATDGLPKMSPSDLLCEDSWKNPSQKITGVIHLGACTDTTEMNVEYLNQTNLYYTKALWTLCARYSVPFVYASSAATYGAGEQGYDDDESKIDQLKPLNPYGDSKQKFDVWALNQELQKKPAPPSWSGFKFFNVYGFGERHKTKMSSVVLQGFDQIRANGKIKLFKSHRDGIADGEQKRDFIYVEDVVQVLLFALKNPIQRGIYNLGSGKARSFLDLANATFQALNRKPQIEFIDTPVAIRDRYQYFTEAKMDKLRQAGYGHPFHTLEEGVKKTVQDLMNHA